MPLVTSVIASYLSPIVTGTRAPSTISLLRGEMITLRPLSARGCRRGERERRRQAQPDGGTHEYTSAVERRSAVL